jgi:hypothetical protein
MGGLEPTAQGARRGFMGKRWDTGDRAFSVEFWREVFRVLKPGGHVLAFGGTRTVHRLACAIEDAGFDIRDQIFYCYGSGFPKSLNVNKALGKQDAVCRCSSGDDQLRSLRETSDYADGVAQEGEEPDVLPSMQRGSARPGVGQARTQGSGGMVAPGRGQPQSEATGTGQRSLEGRCHLPQAARELRQRPIRAVPARTSIDGAHGRLHDGTSASDGPTHRQAASAGRVRASSRSQATEQRGIKPGTLAGQSQPQERGAWAHCERCGKPIIPDGLGTSLKPAVEPIVLARKPLSEGTVAANVLKHGTGALNIDGCRVETNEAIESHQRYGRNCRTTTGAWRENYPQSGVTRAKHVQTLGRWPANLIHDGSDEVVRAFPERVLAYPVTRNGGGR